MYNVNIDEAYHIEKVKIPYLKEMYKKFKNMVLKKYSDLKVDVKKTFIGFKRDDKHNLLSVWFYAGCIEICFGVHRWLLNDVKGLTHNTPHSLAEYAIYLEYNTDFDYLMDLVDQTYEKHPF